jgi:methionine-gamma-lyase
VDAFVSDPKHRGGESTRAIHADREHNPTHAVAPAIFQTSTFRWDSPDDGKAFAKQQAPAEFYSRWGNPNTRQLEALVASLEESEGALAVASGMAAASASIVPWLAPGDHVVGARTLYGEVNTLLTRVLPGLGITSTLAASTEPDAFHAAITDRTRVVVIETPANPTLDCIDIAAIADIARRAGARLVVDNTFATPINTRPLALGAHAAFHSATKYLGGHSDVVAGVIATDGEGITRAWDHLRVHGAVLGPFEAWLVTRGIRTLPLRMARHNANALALARALESHPSVASVKYPGLASHPSHAVARSQMKGFGGMMAIELDGGERAARDFVAKLRLFTLATSLGGVESLVMYPASLSGLSEEKLRAAGIAPGLVRLSIGCEDVGDLEADLFDALGAL